MNIYRNCIAIRSGVMPVHTLIVDGEKIHVNHMNNLNKQCLLDNLRKDGYTHYANAYDKGGKEYALYSNCKYKLAIIDECVKPLTLAELIEKYHLPLTVEDCKRMFNITD